MVAGSLVANKCGQPAPPGNFRSHFGSDQAVWLVLGLQISVSHCFRDRFEPYATVASHLHSVCSVLAELVRASRDASGKGATVQQSERPGAPQLGAAPGTKFSNLLLIKRSYGGRCW